MINGRGTKLIGLSRNRPKILFLVCIAPGLSLADMGILIHRETLLLNVMNVVLPIEDIETTLFRQTLHMTMPTHGIKGMKLEKNEI